MLPISKNRFSRNSLKSTPGSNSDTLNTSTNVYKTFKIILKFVESVQLI